MWRNYALTRYIQGEEEEEGGVHEEYEEYEDDDDDDEEEEEVESVHIFLIFAEGIVLMREFIHAVLQGSGGLTALLLGDVRLRKFMKQNYAILTTL